MKLIMVGDLSMGEHYFSFGHGPRSVAQSRYLFENVHDILSQGDVVCGNLEGPLSNIGYDPIDPESRVFRGDPSAADQLAKAGFNCLQVANNHIVQHGEECFHETVEVLENNGIKVVGLKGQEPAIFTKDEVSIAIIAASDIEDNTYPDQKLYEAFDLQKTISAINGVRNSVDWVVIFLHWGLENRSSPTVEQNDIALRLRDAGANIIVGHHPHIFYSIKAEENFIYAPSLGNFVFDLPWDSRMLRTGILEVELTKRSLSAKVFPVNIGPQFFPDFSESAAGVSVIGDVSIYRNSDIFFMNQIRKVTYFVKKVLVGDTGVKMRFIYRKILSKFGLKKPCL